MAERDGRPQVGIVMGSDSDWDTMEAAAERLKQLEIDYEVEVMSAHRSPKRVRQYAESARRRGLAVLIAGAGGAAHLAGVVAAHTTLPVIGVPVAAGGLGGLDALLATVQMPPGVPVATVAIGRCGAGARTLVRPARRDLPAPLTARSGTIGVRVPGHPLAAALVGALGAPVTAPSANPPGAEPPRRLAEARAYFGERVAVYLDGGVLRGGASTVAAIEGERVRILRPGLVSEAELRAALAES